MDHNVLGGYVTSPKSFIGKYRKIDQSGLFSEQIFGPTHSHCCACGNYNSRVLYDGKTCPKCGVICASNSMRYDVFGKIKTVFPVIKPSKRDKVLKIIKNRNKMIIDPIRADYISAITKFVAVKIDKSKIQIVDNLTPIPDYLTIPFRITGIYSLYLCFKFIDTYFKVPEVTEIFENEYITHEIKVLPPNLRIITYDESKKEERVPKINKFYTCILNLNKTNEIYQSNLHLDEQDWLDKIRTSIKERILDQDIVEPTILEFDMQTAHYQWWTNEIYRMVYEELSGKVGLIRSSILGRNIEFSARTVVTVDPSLPPYQVKVSHKILKRLWMPYFIYYLTRIKGLDCDYCYENLLLNETSNIDMYNNLFSQFLTWMMEEQPDEYRRSENLGQSVL